MNGLFSPKAYLEKFISAYNLFFRFFPALQISRAVLILKTFRMDVKMVPVTSPTRGVGLCSSV